MVKTRGKVRTQKPFARSAVLIGMWLFGRFANGPVSDHPVFRESAQDGGRPVKSRSTVRYRRSLGTCQK